MSYARKRSTLLSLRRPTRALDNAAVPRGKYSETHRDDSLLLLSPRRRVDLLSMRLYRAGDTQVSVFLL
jgi:hypothetical protein